MKTLSRQMLVLVALFAGATFGAMASGCAFVWLGTARADGSAPPQGQVITVPCDVQGTTSATGSVKFAVQSFPGISREDLAAGVSIVADPAPAAGLTIGGDATYAQAQDVLGGGLYVKDGAVAIACQGAGPAVPSVQIYVRQ